MVDFTFLENPISTTDLQMGKARYEKFAIYADKQVAIANSTNCNGYGGNILIRGMQVKVIVSTFV